MNPVQSLQRKAAFHVRGIFRIAGSLGFFVVGYGLAVSVYTERRWMGGNSRVFDPPKWHGWSTEDRDKLIARRERFVQSLKDLYELKEVTQDPATRNLFLEKCVLEDPKIRFVGKEEIFRAFSLMPKRIENLKFTTFEPCHYENKIVINATREYEIRKKPKHFNVDPKEVLRSNLVIHLSKDTNGEERVQHITDEWNSVSLLRPETHNEFMFAGTVATVSRRLSAKLYYLTLKDHKTLLNPFYLTEIPDKVGKFFKERYNPDSTAKNRRPNLNEEGVPLFNAGKVGTKD